MFGTTQLYVFIHPDQMKKTGKKYPDVTYEMAQEEIAAKAGIAVDEDDQSLGNFSLILLKINYFKKLNIIDYFL